MRRLMMALALGANTLVAGAPASAQVTECRNIDCSGRHIECRNSNPIKKLDCEKRKAKWKAVCEAKKAACIATEQAAKKALP